MSTTPTTPPREITDNEFDIPVTPGKSLSTEYLLSLQTAISVSVRSPVSISPPTTTLTRNQRKRVLKNKNLRQGSLRLSVNGLPDPVKERQLERQSARIKRRAKQDLKEGKQAKSPLNPQTLNSAPHLNNAPRPLFGKHQEPFWEKRLKELILLYIS